MPSKLRLGALVEKARRFGLDGFLLALLIAIVLAYFFPGPGLEESSLHLPAVAGYGVSFIFLFYGLQLGPGKLRAGVANWKLHLLIHLVTFVLFPLAGLSLRPFFSGAFYETLWLGIFFLCILPSTVSSSVVMVSIAGGNVPGAIFNASISSLLGVFVTLVWLAAIMNGTNVSIELEDVILKLTIQVVLPVAAGMLLFPKFGTMAARYKSKTRLFDQAVILLIVYTSFCESFTSGVFRLLHAADLSGLALGMIGLFGVMYVVITATARLAGFGREDEITAAFCGSKKSLVQGAVMSKVLFAGTPQAGIILLPIMLYHAFQLIIVGILAQKRAQETG